MNAAEHAALQVEAVRDEPEARLSLMSALYEPLPGRPETHLPYRRAALAFMKWELRRGLLRPLGPRAVAVRGGGRSMSACCETLPSLARIAQGSAAQCPHRALHTPSNSSNILRSSRGTAHNASIVAAYLDHRDLAVAESRVERFFINLVLARVLYAHALVAAPRLAMNWMAPLARTLAAPRLVLTGIFMSLSRVLPERYPLRGELQQYISNEHAFGRLLDVGMIAPRLDGLYPWSARELGMPELAALTRKEPLQAATLLGCEVLPGRVVIDDLSRLEGPIWLWHQVFGCWRAHLRRLPVRRRRRRRVPRPGARRREGGRVRARGRRAVRPAHPGHEP